MTSTPGSETDTTPVPERPEAAAETPKPEATAPAPDPQPEPPPATVGKEPEPAKRPRWLPLAVATAALVLSAAAFVRTTQQEPAVPAMTKAEGADLQRAVSQLESRAGKPTTDEALAARVAALENRPLPADPRVEDLDRRVKALEDSIGGLRGGVADVSQLSGRVETLARTVDSLKADSFNAQGLVLAAGMLRFATSGDGSFETVLRTARALGADDPAIATTLDGIAPFAAKGVPTRSQLTERFAGLSGGMVRAEKSTAQGDWLDRAQSAVSSLITVRRQSGAVAGSGVESVVLRTEAALRSGSLSQAIAEIASLHGPAADVAAPWLADAKARLAVEDAVRTLGQRAMERLQAALGTAEKAQ